MSERFHSKWECPNCKLVRTSPLPGTDMGHVCVRNGKRELFNMRRVWSSKYDEIARRKR